MTGKFRSHRGKIRMEKASKMNKTTIEKIIVSEGDIVILEYNEKYRPTIEIFKGK
jgi:hypothetical protein